LLLVVAAAACGSSAKPSARVTVPPATTSSTAVSSVTQQMSGTVTATETDKGRTVHAHVGDRVDVVLHSTYWTFPGVSDPAVLRPVGAPVTAPQLRGCVPGGGCGTVTASYDAIAPGTAVVSATRTTCGEAMLCTGNAGSFPVTIAVG
jgi:hypothetical protein